MSVWSIAWPRCRLPVTFGGGMTMQNGSASDDGSARKYPASTQRRYMSPSTSPGVHLAGRSAVRAGRVSVTCQVYESTATRFPAPDHRAQDRKCALGMTPCTPTVRSTTCETAKSAAAER